MTQHYKIHYGPAGEVKGYGPDNEVYQPYLEEGDSLVISDSLPATTDAQLFERLRIETERRLSYTDKYATVDYPDSALRDHILAYRADLRALNRQPGAPWDGGGELTPWPTKPEA